MKKISSVLILFSSILFAKDIVSPLPTNIEYNKNIVELGRELFFDTILSKNQDISCNSCHGNYGADKKAFSIGTNSQEGVINTPSIFNIKYHIGFFWNGRSQTLKEQLLDGPITNSHEMASSKELIMSRVSKSKKYIELFAKAYSSKPTFNNLLDSIVEFEKSLITPNSKFDRYLKDELKLSKNEQNGYKLFESYGCVSCHNGINFGANSFQKFGNVIPLVIDSEKWKDRYDLTQDKRDINVFKVPSLRNIEKTAPYFHDGSSQTLKDAIQKMAYYNIGIILSSEEIDDIEAFLNTLTGETPKTLEKSY
jgi:cytochrome c peroxidase